MQKYAKMLCFTSLIDFFKTKNLNSSSYEYDHLLHYVFGAMNESKVESETRSNNGVFQIVN